MRRLRPAELWLACRVFLWSLVLPVFKRVLPLPTLVRLAWTRPRMSGRRPERERQVVRIAYAVWSRSPAARGDGNCLERSLAIYRFLAQANASPELVAGARRVGEDLRGHVWVVVDGEALGEAPEELAQYLPVIVFGAGGWQTWRAGSEATRRVSG